MATMKSSQSDEVVPVTHDEYSPGAQEVPLDAIPANDESLDNDEVTREATGQDLPKHYYRSRGFLGTLFAIGIGTLSAYWLTVLPVNVLGQINSDLGPDKSYILINVVYTMSTAVGMTLVGRLSDLFGRRYFFVCANILSVIGSIIAATSKNINQLIGSGVITGLGVAAQYSFTATLAELLPNRYRFLGNAFCNAISFPPAIFGGVIARSLVAHTGQSWRWIYYINIIIAFIASSLYAAFYFPPSFSMLHKRRTKRELIEHLDVIGTVLFAGGFAMFLLGVSWGGQAYPWKSAQTLGTLCSGVGALIAFGFYECYANLTNPIVPFRLFRNIPYVASCLLQVVAGMLYYSISVLWPQQIAALYTTDPTRGGWMAITVGAGTTIGVVSFGIFEEKLRHTRIQAMAAAVCMTTFVAAMAATNQHNRSLALALTFLGSYSVGVVDIVTMTTAPLVCARQDIGLAAGIMQSLRTAGGSIATAIYTAILQSKLTENIPKELTGAAEKSGLPTASIPQLISAFTSGNATLIQSVPGITPDIIEASSSALKDAYAKSFQVVYLASIAFGAFAIFWSCFTTDVDHLMTNDVARKLHGRKKKNEVTAEKEKTLEDAA